MATHVSPTDSCSARETPHAKNDGDLEDDQLGIFLVSFERFMLKDPPINAIFFKGDIFELDFLW
jgi:hypothetical protein